MHIVVKRWGSRSAHALGNRDGKTLAYTSKSDADTTDKSVKEPHMLNHADEYLLRRVQDEYLEMPGLQLTRAQAQRLWALDANTCGAILDFLVSRRFLTCGLDGQYRRLYDGRFTRELQRAS